jgi:hypothetical protein
MRRIMGVICSFPLILTAFGQWWGPVMSGILAVEGIIVQNDARVWANGVQELHACHPRQHDDPP